LKNSKWREYSSGRPIVQFWTCAWCEALNAIGAGACEKCGMPRVACYTCEMGGPCQEHPEKWKD